jgi:hypothetical protein
MFCSAWLVRFPDRYRQIGSFVKHSPGGDATLKITPQFRLGCIPAGMVIFDIIPRNHKEFLKTAKAGSKTA